MRYVRRDPKTNFVVAHYANEQPGLAPDLLPDDHPDIEAFKVRRAYPAKPSAAIRVDATVVRSPWARGLTRFLAKKFDMTERELLDQILAEAGEQPDSVRDQIVALFDREAETMEAAAKLKTKKESKDG